jgi:lysophospholipase L1-like esterase
MGSSDERESTAARPTPTGFRLWALRLVVALMPLGAVAAVEGVLRLADVCPDVEEALGHSTGDATEWSNRFVRFQDGPAFFGEWARQVAMPKPAGTTRVFALGGSTTAGFGVGRAYPELLAEELNGRADGRRYEVINGGVPAAGSHRIFEVLKEAARFDPDVVIVYVGHNEFLEEVFYSPDSPVGRMERLRPLARRLRLVRWLSRALGLRERARLQFRQAPLQRHFGGNAHFPLIRSTEQYQGRIAFLDSNLQQMIAFARKRGFRLVLVPEVGNLLHRPGDSAHGPGFREPERWEGLLALGKRALGGDDPTQVLDVSGTREGAAAALGPLRAAAALDPDWADTHFAIGMALVQLGYADAAREELARATLLDRRGDRINDDLRRTIVEAARRTGTPWLDPQEALYGQPVAVAGPVGRGLFLDHCHPDQAGHIVLARYLADELLARGLLSRP